MRNKLAKITLAAIFGFALTFNFSCSDGGGNGSGNGNPIKKDKISGVSQKGPFVEGSTVTLYELNERFAQTGRSFKSIIADNKGSFEIKGVELISPYAILEANGYYRNEVTGEVSKSLISLFAIADIREKDNFNVNLLTHLEYYRVLNLVEGGKSVAEAKKQAQKEILSVFGINGNFENSEDMSIFGATEGDAALLAISILLQGDLGEGEFSQRLTNFAQSLKESGKWEDETAKMAMTDWSYAVTFSRMDSVMKFCKYESTSQYRDNCWPMPTDDMCRSGILVDYCYDVSELIPSSKFIRSNILAWGLSSEVPDFGKYVTGYWAAAYGLGGCGSANEGEVKKDNRNVYRICKTGNWTWTSELEYANYQWSCSTANEGEIKRGDVSETEYICKNKAWGVATEFESDTYQWSCSATNEGEIKKGNVSETEYICRDGIWKGVSYKYKYCSENNCSYFTDTRDKQRYAYVVIGEQTWMAENLNYNAGDSKCYENEDVNCDKYGKLYDWATAMGFASSCNDDECSSQITAKHRGICPSGWHLPTNEEWDALGSDAKKLKATSGWTVDNSSELGTDEYGFSALPGGFGFSGGSFYDVGYRGSWWSTSESENSSAAAYYRDMYMYYDFGSEYWGGNGKSILRSVRCLQD